MCVRVCQRGMRVYVVDYTQACSNQNAMRIYIHHNIRDQRSKLCTQGTDSLEQEEDRQCMRAAAEGTPNDAKERCPSPFMGLLEMEGGREGGVRIG